MSLFQQAKEIWITDLAKEMDIPLEFNSSGNRAATEISRLRGGP
jgi:hypothetical protein